MLKRVLAVCVMVVGSLWVFAAPHALADTTCNGVAADYVGTSVANSYTGTGARDVVQMNAGDDDAHMAGGNDLACGSNGDDVFWAGGAAGATGCDKMYGGDGQDFFWDGGGANPCNELYGGAGNDIFEVLKGSYANDGSTGLVNCGAGDDTVWYDPSTGWLAYDPDVSIGCEYFNVFIP